MNSDERDTKATFRGPASTLNLLELSHL
jgi:hypothetical protein